MVEISFNVVLFPLPLGPSKPSTSAGFTLKDMPFTACVSAAGFRQK
jgi:hypothetical protein